jgi:hypothetical protein
MAKFRVLGRTVQHENGQGKVTGQTHFTDDVIHPDVVWGKFLRNSDLSPGTAT